MGLPRYPPPPRKNRKRSRGRTQPACIPAKKRPIIDPSGLAAPFTGDRLPAGFVDKKLLCVFAATAVVVTAVVAFVDLPEQAGTHAVKPTPAPATPEAEILAATAARIANESRGAAPPEVQAAPLPPAEDLPVPAAADRLAGLPEGYAPVRFSGEMAKAPSSRPLSDVDDRSVRMPDWLGSPTGVDALPAGAAANGRGWSFGWIGLAADARRAELETALKGAGGEVVGGAGRLLRVRLPGDAARLAAIAGLPGVDAVGAMPSATKLRAFDGEADAVSDQDPTPVFVTLMADDADGRWKHELTSLGAVVGRYDPQIRVYTANVTRSVLEALAAADFVLGVEPVGMIEAAHDTSIPAMGADALRTWAGDGVFSGVAGTSVPVGVMDTGLNIRHADIAEHRTSICGANFVADDARAQDEDLWVDADGHGTHVTGTIAGNGFLSGAFAGMAPSVRDIRIAKVLDSDGGGSDDGINRGMDWLAEASGCGGSDAVRPLIVNMSLSHRGRWEGRSVGPRKLDAVVWDSRQLYVVAQANAGASAFSDYASAKNSLSVGAAFDGGDVAPFSSHGPTADGRLAPLVVGTGVDVCSAAGGGSASGYDCASGTSMASPAVAGVAALLMDAAPEHASQPALARARLMASAIRPDAWLDDPASFPADNSDGPGDLQAFYGLGKVSARTAVLNRDAADGWTGGGAGADFAEGATDYAYRDVEVPEGASRLDVVLTWDEPPVDAVADPVLNDLDLWLDRLADCGDGPCGEHASRSRADNVEWVIVRNPEPGTWRLKVVPERAYTASRAAVAWTVVRGASTPRLAIDADHSSGADGDSVTLSLSTDAYVAAGASLHFGCRGAAADCGALRIGIGEVPREDGLASRAEADDDHGDTFALATTVAVPSTTEGELEVGGDKDYFRLEVAEATTLTVESTGDTDTYGTLFDASETSLATNDDGGPGSNFRIEREVQAGTYYVEVRGFGSSTTGSYELGVSSTGGGGSDRAVPLGTRILLGTRIPLGEIAAGETLAIDVDLAYTGSGDVRLYYTAGAWNAEGASGSVVVRARAGGGTDAPPAAAADNDGFADAAPIGGVEGSVALDLAGATAEPGEPPASTLSREFPRSDERRWHERPLGSVWFEWTAPADDLVTLWLAAGSPGPGSETVDVFAGDDIVGATGVATNQRGKREPIILFGLLLGYDQTLSSAGSATFFAEAGETYRVRVAHSEASAPLTLRWRQGPRPANDDFAAAQTLAAADGSFAGTNAGATLEAGETLGVLAATTWHRWTAPSDGAWRFAVDRSDLRVAVFTGDNVRDARLVSGLPGEDATFRAGSGQVYRVVVAAPDAFAAGSPYELTWEPAEWDPDPGDDFASAAGLDLDVGGAGTSLSLCNSGFFTTYDNNYTVEPGEPVGTGARTRWWSWTAPDTAAYTWRVGTEDGLTLAAFGGDALGSLEATASTGPTGREFSFAADGGRTYRISLGWPVGDVGAFTERCASAEVSLLGRTPVNDERSAAIALGSTRGSTAVDDGHFGTTGPGELADGLGHSSLWWEWEAPTSGWYTFQTGSVARHMAVYEGGSTTPVSRSAGADGRVTFRAVAGRSYTIRIGSPATDDGAPFSLEWRPSDPPAWLGFAGSFADALDADGDAFRLVGAGDLAFEHDDRLYTVSGSGLTVFRRDADTGALTGAGSIDDDVAETLLVHDPARNRMIANRCGTWRVYGGVDGEVDGIDAGELAVDDDPATCGRRLFLDPAGSFLYRVVPDLGIEVFAAGDDGGLRHVETTSAAIRDAAIRADGDYVYGLAGSFSSRILTFRRDGETGALEAVGDRGFFGLGGTLDTFAISDDGHLFGLGESTGFVVLFDVRDGTPAEDPVTVALAEVRGLSAAAPFGFAAARSGTGVVDVLGRDAAVGIDVQGGRTDVLASGREDRDGNRVPLFGRPNALAASPDGRHVYAATYDRGIVAFERIGAGVDPADPHVRLDILTVSSGLVSFGGETDSDGCIAVDGLEHDGTEYTVRSSKWQRRRNADWDWSDVAGTSATGEVCPHAPSEPGHYRLVAEIEVDGEAGRYASDVLVHDDHGDSTGDATTVGVPSATAGWLEPDDADYFQIELAASGTLTVYTEGWTDTEGRLLDGDGGTVASDADSGEEANFRISRNLDAGTYYVRVRGSAGTQGDYTLHAAFEAATADLVVASATLSATPAVGETFTLDAVVRNDGDGGAAATTLRYYRSDDGTITREDDEIGTAEVAALDAGESSEHSIEVTVEEAGSYSYGACVDSVDGESDTANNCSAAAMEPSGDDHGDTFATATSVAVPSTTEGELEEGGDKDYFRLEVAEATTLAVETTGSTDTYGTLFDGDETSLETNDDSGPGTNFRIERDVQAGTYYVEVRGFGSSTTGSYELSVSAAAGSASGFGLDAQNSSPEGVAHADGLLYIVDSSDEKVYVYTTSGERRAGADFDLDAENSSPERLAHADGLIYVVDDSDDKVYVYTTSGQRRAGSDFDLDGHGRWTGGIAHADGMLYVLDWDVSPGKVYVYTTSGQRRAGSDFDLQRYRSGGIAHADGLLYISTWTSAVDVHAYTTSGERRPDDDFDLDPANSSTQGIDYGGGRFYVLDDDDGRVFVYESGSDGGSQGDARPRQAEEAAAHARVTHAFEKDRQLHSLLTLDRETEDKTTAVGERKETQP